jgi:glycosyltransferase 2 family protein
MDPNPSPAPAPSRSKFLHWAIALGLAGVLLYYSLRGIDWHQVWSILETTRLNYVGLMLIVTTGSLFLRAVRWRVLLQAGGPVHMSTAFWATCAGYFGNNFLPARAGELVRTIMVDSEAGLGRTFVLTTALSERMVDAITLVFISSLVLLTLSVRPGWYATAAKPFAIIGICGVVGIAILPKLERLWHYLLDRTPVPERFRGKLKHILEQILFGLRSFHDRRRLVAFLGLSAVIWFMDAIGFILAARSLDISLTLSMSFLLITGLGLGSALPSTPGYVGIYQFVAVTVLMPFGFSRVSVIAYTLLLQVLQYLSTAIWGLFALLRFRKLKKGTMGRTLVSPAMPR